MADAESTPHLNSDNNSNNNSNNNNNNNNNSNNNSNNREVWLQAAIEKFRPIFEAIQPLPKIKVSVGLPHGRGAKKIIGQHWCPEASDDLLGSIFISPTIDNGETVLATLAHELVHASVGNGHGHGAVFAKMAKVIGLTGQMRSTTAGPLLKLQIQLIIAELGPYPHSKLNLGLNPIKKQTTRMIKLECQECGYIVRTSRLNVAEKGPVLCPCNYKPMDEA